MLFDHSPVKMSCISRATGPIATPGSSITNTPQENSRKTDNSFLLLLKVTPVRVKARDPLRIEYGKLSARARG
jgi:hypothetical protein